MQYIKMNVGSENCDPGATLYELDDEGGLHRYVQIDSNASQLRFAPENVLFRRAVNVAYLSSHPASEVVSAVEFERIWSQVRPSRPFLERVPDITCKWAGRIGQRRIRWVPTSICPESWQLVPGFERLFTDDDKPRAIARDILLERPIQWAAA